ncbi:MAG: cold shock domain-containing protein [Balneolaceae bacterium]
MSSKKVGTVKWFHNIKGYGFINSDTDEEIFVHYSEINSDGFKKLKRGEKVEFTLDTGDKGLLARDVTLIGGTSDEDLDLF